MYAIDKFLEKHGFPRAALSEMAVVCHKNEGAGITIWVVVDQHPVPHAHVMDLDTGREISIKITDNPPTKNSDIVVLAGVADDAIKAKIVRWAGGCKGRVKNWDRLIVVWDAEQP